MFPPLVLPVSSTSFLPPLRFGCGVDGASAGVPIAYPAVFSGAALTIFPFFGSPLPTGGAGGCLVVPLVGRRATFSVVSIGAEDSGPFMVRFA